MGSRAPRGGSAAARGSVPPVAAPEPPSSTPARPWPPSPGGHGTPAAGGGHHRPRRAHPRTEPGGPGPGPGGRAAPAGGRRPAATGVPRVRAHLRHPVRRGRGRGLHRRRCRRPGGPHAGGRGGQLDGRVVRPRRALVGRGGGALRCRLVVEGSAPGVPALPATLTGLRNGRRLAVRPAGHRRGVGADRPRRRARRQRRLLDLREPRPPGARRALGTSPRGSPRDVSPAGSVAAAGRR